MTKIPISGMEEALDFHSLTEINLVGTNHTLRYRNRFRERTDLHITARLSNQSGKYVINGRESGTVTDKGRVWSHTGMIPGRAKGFLEKTALAVCQEEPLGDAEISYEITSSAPDSDMITGHCRVELN